jgi:hypothetical protein
MHPLPADENLLKYDRHVGTGSGCIVLTDENLLVFAGMVPQREEGGASAKRIPPLPLLSRFYLQLTFLTS